MGFAHTNKRSPAIKCFHWRNSSHNRQSILIWHQYVSSAIYDKYAGNNCRIFLKVDPNHIDILTRTLGFIWSMVVGGLYSLLYIIALELTGWDYLVTKALIVVSGGWLIGVGLAMKLVSIALYTRGEPLSIAAFFVAHLVFATSLGLLTKKIGIK